MPTNLHRYGCRCTSCNAGDTLHPKAKKRLQNEQLQLPDSATETPAPPTAKKTATKK